MYCIGNAVDRFATNALTESRAATMAKKHKELLEDVCLNINTKEMSSDPIHNQRVQSIVAGSLMANDRLKETKLTESRKCCYCQNQNATLRHIVWQCEKWKNERQPYIDAIQTYIDKVSARNNERRQKIGSPSQTVCSQLWGHA